MPQSKRPEYHFVLKEVRAELTRNELSFPFFTIQAVLLFESICNALLHSGSFDLNRTGKVPEEHLVVVRAVVLGTSILVNAYLLYAAGDPSIDPRSAETNPSVLPKYPLGVGATRKLHKHLVRLLNSDTYIDLAQDLRFALDDPRADVQRILESLNTLLKDTIGDSLSFFSIRRNNLDRNSIVLTEFDIKDMGKMHVKRYLDGSLIAEIKANSKEKPLPCHGFLAGNNSPASTQATKSSTNNMDLTSDEIATIARRDDEEEARAIIGRFAYKILNKDLFDVAGCKQRTAKIRRMGLILKRFIARCVQKTSIQPQFGSPGTWMALEQAPMSISCIPNPYDFPAYIVTHRRQKRDFLHERAKRLLSVEKHGSMNKQKTQRQKYIACKKYLRTYGQLASDCEIGRLQLEQCLRVCENNIKLGGSNTGNWARNRQETIVEIDALNQYLATIALMFDKGNIKPPKEGQLECMKSSYADHVEKFLDEKIKEERRLLQDEEEKQQNEDGLLSESEADDLDDYDDFDYDDIPSSRKRR